MHRCRRPVVPDVVFLVPALPIRYGLGFYITHASTISALVLIVVAASSGLREVFAHNPGRPVPPSARTASRSRWITRACLLRAASVVATVAERPGTLIAARVLMGAGEVASPSRLT